MNDQSFDAFTGEAAPKTYGGWGGGGGAGEIGDQSFVATQAAPKTADFDRVTVPVTVATLNNLEPGAEKITYGNYHFTTVRIIGEVVNTIDTQGTEVRYMIRDCGNQHQEPFLVIQYFGIDGTDRSSFIEGTVVHVVGKIRSFDNHTGVVAFTVLEVTDLNLRDIFPKEARISELYYLKNVPERITSGNMHEFVGTMLSSEIPPSNLRGPNTPGRTPMPATPGLNGSAIYTHNTQTAPGLNVQQTNIIQYIKSRSHLLGEEGISTAELKNAIHGDANFDADVIHLAENGVLFQTMDENHYNIM